MTEKPNDLERRARGVAFLGLVLVTWAFFGLAGGLGEALQDQPPRAAVVVGQPTIAEATEALFDKVTEIQFRAEYRQLLGASNALISLMLLVSGIALLGRQGYASWLVLQSLIAKALWTLGDAASQASTLWGAEMDLRPYLAQLQAVAGDGDQAPSMGFDLTWAIRFVLLGTAIRIAFIAWLGWQVRRATPRDAAP